MKYLNLTPEIRTAMLEEFKMDLKSDTVNIPSYLKDGTKKKWLDLLGKAISKHDDSWLSSEMKKEELLKRRQLKNLSSGSFSFAMVPGQAEDLLAQDEFNYYYMRGICRFAIMHDMKKVTVYQGKKVDIHRVKSLEMLNTDLDANVVLEDLKYSPRGQSHLGLGLPNSSLSLTFNTQS